VSSCVSILSNNSDVRNFSILLALLLGLQCSTPKMDPSKGNKESRIGEFEVHENGLIYDETTMSELEKLVDSLSLRFQSCVPNDYYSLEQGYGTSLSLGRKHVRKAMAAMSKNVSLNDFIKLFTRSGIVDSLWIVKTRHIYNGKPSIEYEYVNVPDTPEFDKSRGWVYEETWEGIDILYLHELSSPVIPSEYATLIQYVDCLVDTTATIFPSEELPDSLKYKFAPGSRVKAFVDFAMDFEPEPTKPGIEIDDPHYSRALIHYDSLRKDWEARLISSMEKKMQNPDNLKLLNDAVEEAIPAQNGLFLEYYAERYLPSAKVLELKRSYRVHGFCSRDSGPRDHAMSICMLAAKTHQWDIFLRAHLDILNDNFLRAMDGAYAWRTRGTYIGELEALDINTVDLLVGTVLTSSNVHNNHYSASRSRVGRAMAESKYRPELESLLLRMIQDKQLDLFNRMEMAFTFLSYNRNLTDRDAYFANLEKVKSAIKTLPRSLQGQYSNLLNDLW
jgi:hypothetical protein